MEFVEAESPLKPADNGEREEAVSSSSSSSSSSGRSAENESAVLPPCSGGEEEEEHGKEQLEIAKDITRALKAKEDGNGFFRDKDWDGAVTLYSQAIAYCPDDEANRENMAVFLGNRAAAYFSLEEFALVVDDCTLALESKSDYVKVLARRMQAYEKLERTDEALQDAKQIQQLDAAWPRIAQTVARLEKESAEKMEKMKEEALGKLKDIGNSILGNFGMSLDNFNFKQDPATGGWTIGMDQKG